MNENIKQKLIDLIGLAKEIHDLILDEEDLLIKNIAICTDEVQIKSYLEDLDIIKVFRKDFSKDANNFTGIMKSIVFNTYVSQD